MKSIKVKNTENWRQVFLVSARYVVVPREFKIGTSELTWSIGSHTWADSVWLAVPNLDAVGHFVRMQSFP